MGRRFGAALGLLALALPAWAQYPGLVNPSAQSNGPHLRATAVLEYTGTLDHIKASRLVPIAVWDGLEYEPGALYLADPQPLAVLTGTQYELENDGESKGFFNISDSEQIAGLWVGVGRFKAPKLIAKLKPPEHTPYVVGGNIKTSFGQPHFAHVPQGSPATAEGPTLHRRSPDDQSQDTASASAADTQSAARTEAQTEDQSGTGGPILHRRGDAAATPAPASRLPIDPDRPRLSYANPDAGKDQGPAALLGFPAGMKQIVAVSDNRKLDRESHQFVWTNVDDEAKMQAALEKIAQQALMPPSPAEPAKPAAHQSHAARHRKKAALPPPLPALEDVQFHAYSLTFGSGATLVLTAHCGADPVQYVTIIAQPDFYGTPQVLLKQVTSLPQMDAVPRMRLIDAVDTTGDGRADLVFELQGYSYREFAIYSVYDGTARQAFVTQPESTPKAIVNPNSIS